MADYVEQVLHAMVPELDDLRRKRIFNDGEIKQIVHRRREFEYTLLRNNIKPLDYLNYIRYEVALECLRRRRSKALHWKKRSLSDATGLQRLCALFDRCVRKFKADKRLWYQYIDFCLRSGSTKKLARVLLRAVKLHPREVHFWLLAADRELKLGHVRAARTLLTRGLRCAPRSAKLWAEFLRLEVQVACHLIALRAGDGSGAEAAEAAAGGTEGGEAPAAAGGAWAPACVLLRRALGRLAKSPRGCAALLTAAAGCLGQVEPSVAARPEFGGLREQLRRAIADHRPGVAQGGEWEAADAETATALWELWWTQERAAARDWRAVAEDIIRYAPFAVMQHCVAMLARLAATVDNDQGPKAALLDFAKAPRTVTDADTAVAVLEALQRCAPSGESTPLVAASNELAQAAAIAHPSCAQLAVVAWRRKPVQDPREIMAFVQRARNTQPAHAAQLLLLGLDSQHQAAEAGGLPKAGAAGGGDIAAIAAPLGALLRALPPDADAQPVLDALLAWALVRSAAVQEAALAAARTVAAALFDRPALRAAALAGALSAELRTGAAPSAEATRRQGERCTELVEALDAAGDAQGAAKWRLRHAELAERAARWGCDGEVRPAELHRRALRAVPDQAAYAERASRRLRLSVA